MLNNATQIISNVPGKHLNPLLLAQSQWNDSSGFMMIAYTIIGPDANDSASRFYDLFFLSGSHIYDCARMNSDLRFQLHLDDALQTFSRVGREEGTRVFLFVASDEVLSRFRSTFYYEPCLKVHLDGLSGKQIHRLLTSTKCKKGIIECNEFYHSLPSIELKEITSPDDISQYRPPFKHGRILIYDTDRNKELLSLNHDSHTFPSKTTTNSQSIMLGEGGIRSDDPTPSVPSGSLFSAADEKEAEEFTAFITRFLKSAPPGAPEESVVADDISANSDISGLGNLNVPNPPPKSFIVTHRDSENSSVSTTHPRPCPAPNRIDPPLQGRGPRALRKTRRSNPHEPSAEIQPLASPSASSEYIRLFDRLFRSFRQQVFDVFGDKSESVIADAVRRGRFLTPEFDLQNLSDETAIIILDIIEHIANEAPFLKRPRLRQAALTLVADLYNKQYEILENNRVIDKVEQFYYKLKK